MPESPIQLPNLQPILTAAESRSFDKYLIEELGIPSPVLMENAAQAALETIEDWLEEHPDPEVAIFCGPGNNGGDGFALARLLVERNIWPTVFLAGKVEKLSNDARLQYDILSKLLDPDEAYTVESAEEILELVDAPVILVDALLGTGWSGEPHGAVRAAIDAMGMIAASGHVHVLAIDLPTGMNCDEGVHEATDAIVLADRTVTMGTPKIGFYQGESKQYTGDISIAQLGAPYSDAVEHSSAFLVEEADVVLRLPEYPDTASKVTRGRVLCICGSRGMTGAAILSATAALRAGCGWVNVAVPKSERQLVAQAMPELLTVGLSEDESGSPDIRAWEELQEHLERADALLIGSGLRPVEGTADLLRKIIGDVDKPLVIDAGGLGALVGHLDLLKSRKSPTVLTPHVGEIARLVDRPWQEVERERLAVARVIATKYGVTLVMKGAPTYTVDTKGTAYINSTGNVGLATAGSGDVLAGMIVSMIVQSQGEAMDATMAAVYLHGLAGDFAAKEKTTHGMTAMDVINALPLAFKEVGVE